MVGSDLEDNILVGADKGEGPGSDQLGNELVGWNRRSRFVWTEEAVWEAGGVVHIVGGSGVQG